MYSTFNYTEEAFLLSSSGREVVKVWARGSGQASFNLKISDGKAEVQLGFQLGHLAEPHCNPVLPARNSIIVTSLGKFSDTVAAVTSVQHSVHVIVSGQ